MVSYEDKWVRIFLVQDTSQHKKGFTLYKVVSMLYPRDCPDAVTKVVVWKRFNDFKKLHRDVKTKCKSLKFKSLHCTTIPKTSYFKRFQENVIEERRTFILNFLNFIGQHAELYTSDAVVNFFKSSYTPSELLGSNINSIRSDLNLPAETEYYTANNSDNESEADSISTINSLNSYSVQIDALPDPLNDDVKNTFSENNSCLGNGTDIFLGDGQDICSSRANSCGSISSVGNYILEAAQCISNAIQFETEKKYEDAFQEYKTGVDILLKNSKDEKNVETKEKVRQKIEKYLLRQEKIYNLYLSAEIKDIRQYVSNYTEDNKNVSSVPISDLYKYKVIKAVGSGMVILHIENQLLFYAKVIYKTSTFNEENLILPNNVPYFVQLKNYFNCENAVFLILQFVSTPPLRDYIKQTFETNKLNSSESLVFENLKSKDLTGEESDCSYSDLINDYKNTKMAQKVQPLNNNVVEEQPYNQNSILEESNHHFSNSDEEPKVPLLDTSDSENFTKNNSNDNIVVKSQELLSIVDDTLRGEKEIVEFVHGEKDDSPSTEEYEFINSTQMDVTFSVEYVFDETPSDLPPVMSVIKWSAQLLLALEKLHSMGVIYGNLQMKHLLLDENENLILAYKYPISNEQELHIDRDNVIAPELYNFQKLTPSVDWWNYGIILYELLVGMEFKLVHPEEFTFYTVLRIPKYVPLEGRSLLKQLIVFDPRERLGSGVTGTDDIKSHPFFNNISWTTLVNDGHNNQI